MLDLGLTKGDDGPKYLERRKQERRPVMVSFVPFDEYYISWPRLAVCLLFVAS
jgi:hypothetical protein